MIQRILRGWLDQQAQKKQITEVVGLRQVGKTTLMESVAPSCRPHLHYRFQDLVTLRRYEAQPELWADEVNQFIVSTRKAGALPHIFVDEVQKIPAIYQALQGLYDRHKGGAKFWVWGSSARAQKRQKAETLAGRVLSRHLWPLCQQELLETTSCVPLLSEPARLTSQFVAAPRAYERSLCTKYLSQSLLPEPHLEDRYEDALELLVNYQASYLENEIRRENLVSDIGNFERFLRLAASLNGGCPNLSEMGRTLSLSPNTVQAYYRILIDTFVVLELPAFSASIKVQMAKRPRLFFVDTGLARSLAGVRHVPALGTGEFGQLFESWAITEIIKQLSYNALPWQTYYLRTKNGKELDLVIVPEPGRAIAVELKGSSQVQAKHLKHIRAFMQADKRFTHGIVISLDPRCAEIEPGIFNLPAWYL